MKENKWYLKTWFLCLLAAFWFLIIPIIILFVLLLLRKKEENIIKKKYGEIDDLDLSILNKTQQQQDVIYKLDRNITERHSKINELNNKINLLDKELKSLDSDIIVKHFTFSDYKTLSSEECKNKLAVIKLQEQNLIKDEKAIIVSQQASTKTLNNNIKQLLRCFNAECESITNNVTSKNIDVNRNKIVKSFESLNKIFQTDGIHLTEQLLEYKLEELNLLYSYELIKENEREQQKAIKEQMIEEEKVRREIEREKAKIEKDQQQFTNEVNKLMSYLQKTDNDIEKQLYIDKIKDLEEKIKELEKAKENVLEREANARAGFVYIISNIGSFGENIYKIGMTRRLEPMDRIKELSSASVPFEFDVHAMIFAEDAPALENSLHKYFEKQSVNKVNLRKEFFKINIGDIEKYILSNFNNTVQFTKIPTAREYRQSVLIESENIA